jgi:predicted negative regulator of RcsB-dependent stress response
MKEFLKENKWKVAMAVLVIFGVGRACGWITPNTQDEAEASYYNNTN